MRKARIPNSIIGRTIAFDKYGDLVNGRFYLYKLAASDYRLIG